MLSLYTSRLVLQALGVSDFGVYNVVGGFVSLFGFFNTMLSSSMSRFFNFEGGQRGEAGIRDVYTAGFWVHVILAVIMVVLLETFGLWYINNVMVIPQGRIHAANFLFQCSVLSLMLVMLGIPYSSAIMSYEHISYYAIVSVIDVILKFFIALSIPVLPFDQLISYAALILLVSVLDFFFYFIYAKRSFAAIKLGKSINGSLLKSFLSFSGWNLMGTLAYMAKGQGVNLILNIFFGTIVNAARGIAFQMSSAVSGFTQSIITAFKPQTVDAYAKNNFVRVKALYFFQSKIAYGLVLILIVPLILEIDYVLSLWLGNTIPAYANTFAVLVLFDLLIGVLNSPTTQLAFTTGNIRLYQICSAIVNLTILPACWFVLRMGFSPYSAFIIVIIASLLNQTSCLICLKKVFPYSIADYILSVILPLLIVTILVPIIPVIIRFTIDASFARFFLVSMFSTISACLLIWKVLLKENERHSIVDFIIRTIKDHYA